MRFDAAMQQRVSLPAYAASIFASYLSWIGIAVAISKVRKRAPMFCDQVPYWWLLHAGLSIAFGLVHLIVDTALLWLAFSQSFDYLFAITEKIMQWLPYEILAYWTCLCVFTVASREKSFVSEAGSEVDYLRRFVIRNGDTTQLIAVSDIDWIESYDNYALLWQGDEKHLIRESMSNLEARLDPARFNRVHRKIIVNLKEAEMLVRSSGGALLQLKGGKQVPVSRRRQAQLKRVLESRAAL